MISTLLLSFPTRGHMLEAIDYLNSLENVEIHNTALIAKAEDGETTIYEDDISPNEGAIAGGTLGSLMGTMGLAGLGALLLPGVGAVLALGAGGLIGGLLGGSIGALTGKAVDLGIDNDKLEVMAGQLANNQVALVIEAALDEEDIPAIAEAVSAYGAVLTKLSA